MEEYIREAPTTAPVPNETIEHRQLDFVPYQEEEQTPEPIFEAIEEPVAEDYPPEPEEEPQFADDNDEDEPETPTTADLLGLHEVNPAAAALEESNALALAIVPQGGSDNAPGIGFGEITGSSGWELALVTAQPRSSTQLTESKLAGGLDKLLLDSLYEDAAMRQQQASTLDAYGYGNGQQSSQMNDPFAMSAGVAAPTGVQMSVMAQQQQAMFGGMPQQLQFQHQYGSSAAFQFNPFGDAYSAAALASQSHGSGSLI
ncbi:unnamed protein product [Urochloa humidicola]